MNNEEPGTSSGRVRWLKMLTLPVWVKLALAWIMVAGALSPAQPRDFAQDLAFFARGLLETFR
ncbi:MAG: hypothetical protein U1E12_10625 [Hydrogenophaga sp.]|uniref:hypothetical protein n=1 Tax=Hydrogenophaga sp. TaxID=1904254 RepID=UPI002ABAEFDB|nr:hypothetical protein [Hydrogenophaga sp.]MDZ4102117.1 hypothetical protein [Hydrogenophaga sp.]